MAGPQWFIKEDFEQLSLAKFKLKYKRKYVGRERWLLSMELINKWRKEQNGNSI